MKFLQSKSAWYWPVIVLEKAIITSIIILLISSMILHYELGEPVFSIVNLSIVAFLLVLILILVEGFALPFIR